MEEETLTIHTSMLMITKDGDLKRLYCPFQVQVIITVRNLEVGETHPVTSIHMGERKLLYVIASQSYPYDFFVILLNRH